MRRNTLNFIVDFVSLIAMAGLVATGLIVKYILPPGSGGRGSGSGLSVWGWSRHDWGDVHFYIAIGILALMLIHVVLHWRWVCAVVRSLLGVQPGGQPQTARIVAGIALLVLVCGGTGGVVWAAARDVEGEMPSGRGRGRAAMVSDSAGGQHGADHAECDHRGGNRNCADAEGSHERGCGKGEGGERRRRRGGRGDGNGRGRGRGQHFASSPAATASQP